MDTKHIIKCPACGHKMTKVRIPDADFLIDICTEGCGGILFDNRELKSILNKQETLDKIIKYLENSSFKIADKSDERICPVCNTPMSRMGDDDILGIDVCNSCGAKFLDNDELKKVKNITG